MAIVAALVLAQKLLPPSRLIDMPVPLTTVGLGIVIIVARDPCSGICSDNVKRGWHPTPTSERRDTR